MTNPELHDDTTVDRTADDTPSAPEVTNSDAPPQYGVGPFSIREVALGGVWLVAFILSFLPLNLVSGDARPLFGGVNVWVSGLSFILTIGLPTIAVFLLALRRLSPQGIRRVGSLGIDQFASVAFSVAALVWLTTLWDTVAVALETNGFWTRSWVLWAEVVLMLAGVVLTVFAPLIPVLEQDFQDRPEVPAHRNARPVRPVVARPRRERPAPAPAPEAAAEATPTTAYAAPAAAPVNDTGAHDTGAYGTDVFAPLAEDSAAADASADAAALDDTVLSDSHATTTPAQQAFWALVPEERDVVDEYGAPLFRIGPTAWALVIEDRGEVFVVRHEDGRIGYLHDTSGVTRG